MEGAFSPALENITIREDAEDEEVRTMVGALSSALEDITIIDEEEDEEEEVDEEEGYEEEVIIVEEEEEEEVGILRRGRVHPGGAEGDKSIGGGDQGIVSPKNGKEQAEEEKKEAEPFAVPTAGAFYMHDDRFRDNGGARPRRSAGGRKLWEAKDDRAWVHDRFEELNLQDDDEKYRRGGRGRFRGRGRGRGGRHGSGRGNRYRTYEDTGPSPFVRRGGGRGRGSRRKEGEVRNVGDSPMGINKQASKAADTLPNNTSSKATSQPASGHVDAMNAKKHVSSSLSSASPPFYPSGTQHQSVLMPFKREAQYGGSMRSTSSSVVAGDEETRTSNTTAMSRNGKNMVSVRGQSQSQGETALRSSAGKQTTNMQQTSKSSSVNMPLQQLSKVQGRNSVSGGQPISHPTNSGHQITRGTNFTKTDSTVQQRSVQTQGQGGSRAASQQTVRQPIDNSQSPAGTSTSDVGNTSSQPVSNKGKNVALGRTGGNPQGTRRGSYVYNGTQAITGTSGASVAHTDQNFPHAPTLLPVMQFGGQHHAGLGVPAVGMALPGYVAQPQLGFGATEMTWVPLLAGAAGALGATYCSPYIAVDSSYYPQPTAQPSSFGVAGRDSDGNKPQNTWKPNSRSELVNDEFGQRQNKPRRYSEMNFGQ
uniref:Btz domain-containing protein n=1 Tax=Araucaria cunninghamii TaxID=56994 RepID=A0A0D6QWN6_ARACU